MSVHDEFPELALSPLPPDECDAVVREAERVLPELTHRRGDVEMQAAPLACYADRVTLLRLAWTALDTGSAERATGRVVYALRGGGRVWPIDEDGHAIAAVNRLWPPRLADDDALRAYVRFRTAFLGRDADALAADRRAVALQADTTRLERREPRDRSTRFVVHLALRPTERTPPAPEAWQPVEGCVLEDGTLMLATEGMRLAARPTADDAAQPSWRRATPVAAPAPAFVAWRAPEADDPDGLTPDVLRRVLEATTLADEPANAPDSAAPGEALAPLDRVIVRIASLPFYRSVRLVQCVDPHAGRGMWHPTWYLLVHAGRTEAAAAFFPLDGSSNPLHQVNEQETDEGAELQLTDATAGPYLEFFTWAVRGEEGAFLMPHEALDLPLTRWPPPAMAEVLEQHLAWARDHAIPTLQAPRVAPEPWRFDTLIGYSNALFRAVMTVTPTGQASMEDDDPLIADLPMSTAQAGATGGGRLRRRAPRPPAVPTDETAGAADAAALPPATDTTWLHVDGRQLGTELPEDIAAALRDGTSVHFSHCTFRASLRFAGRTLGSLAFVECDFAPERGRPALDLEDATLRGSLLLQRCRVAGDLMLRRLTCERGLRIRGCLLLASPAVETPASETPTPRTLAQIGLAVDQEPNGRGRGEPFRIVLDEVTVTGAVEVGLCSGRDSVSRSLPEALRYVPRALEGEALLTECAALSLVDARLGGALDLVGLSTRHLDLTAVTVQGSLRVTADSLLDDALARHARFGRLSANGARIGGDLVLARAQVDGDLTLDRCDVDGDLSVQRSVIAGNLSLLRASVRGWIGLEGAAIGGDLSLHFASLPGYITARSRQSLSVGGDIGFSGATLGFVELRAIDVRGRLYATNATATSVTLGAGVVRHGDGAARWPSASRVGGVRLEHVTVHGHLDFGGTVFTGAPGGDVAPSERLRWTDDDAAVVRLSNVEIAGDLRFAHTRNASALAERITDLDERGAPWRWHRPAQRRGGSESGPHELVAASDIDTARQPGLEDLEAFVDGGLQVRACRIGGHLDLRSTVVDGLIDCTATQVGLGVECGAALEDPIRGVTSRLRTLASGVLLEGASCGGSIDLTGVRVVDRRRHDRRSAVPRSAREDGSIRARGAQVTGNFLLEPVDASLAKTGLHGRIEGELDLSAMRANRIVLSNRVFDDATPQRRRAVLERSHVSRLDIRSPVPALDLTAITVDRWELGELEEGADDTDRDAARYIAVLRSMTPLDRSVWVQVERDLRNGAQDDDANRVYTALRQEARRQRDGRARTLLDLAYGWALGYGTRPLRPLLVSTAGALGLLWTLANPAHVVLADEQVGALALRCRGDAPLANASTCAVFTREAARSGFQVQLSAEALGEDWTLRDNVALMLRYAVPIISITTDSDWVPAEARTVRLPGTAWHTSPKALAFYLALYNWIAIPIALGFFSARLLRS